MDQRGGGHRKKQWEVKVKWEGKESGNGNEKGNRYKSFLGKGNRKLKGEGKEAWRENLQIGWDAEVE